MAMGQQLGDDVTASITGGRTRNSQFSSSGHQRLRPCLVPHQTQNILNFGPTFWEMDLNTTQNFLETHTHSEFWFLKSRGQNKPNLGLVHVLLAHTAPNRCSPALPPPYPAPDREPPPPLSPTRCSPEPYPQLGPNASSLFLVSSPISTAPGPSLPPPSRRCASGRGRPRPSRPPSRRSTSPRWPRLGPRVLSRSISGAPGSESGAQFPHTCLPASPCHSTVRPFPSPPPQRDLAAAPPPQRDLAAALPAWTGTAATYSSTATTTATAASTPPGMRPYVIWDFLDFGCN